MHTKILALLALATFAHAHMHLYFPPTLKGDNNPYTQGDADPYLNYPYDCCGRANPGLCKGHLGLLDTDEGKPVVTWSQGQKANFSLSGATINTPTWNADGGNHYGGSCMVGFSVDSGKTFKVATTWQGNCPLRNNGVDPANQVFDFQIPADIPVGNAVFAWTWVNREKEFNMNCASVSIAGSNGEAPEPSSTAPASATRSGQGAQPTSTTQYKLEDCTCQCPSTTFTSACSCTCSSPSTKRHMIERKALAMHKRALSNAAALAMPIRRAASVAYNDLPDMLLSIDMAGADCESVATTKELQWPNPGPNVVIGDGEYPLETPSGSCTGGVVGAFAS